MKSPYKSVNLHPKYQSNDRNHSTIDRNYRETETNSPKNNVSPAPKDLQPHLHKLNDEKLSADELVAHSGISLDELKSAAIYLRGVKEHYKPENSNYGQA